ncbi:MAG: hypothetical protein ACJ0S4_04200 [Candidatus Rariloculaceae bacterium]
MAVTPVMSNVMNNVEENFNLALPGATLIALLFALPGLLFAQTPERPDILFIVIDDMNDWISPLDGHPQAKTPNMEAASRTRTTVH